MERLSDGGYGARLARGLRNGGEEGRERGERERSEESKNPRATRPFFRFHAPLFFESLFFFCAAVPFFLSNIFPNNSPQGNDGSARGNKEKQRANKTTFFRGGGRREGGDNTQNEFFLGSSSFPSLPSSSLPLPHLNNNSGHQNNCNILKSTKHFGSGSGPENPKKIGCFFSLPLSLPF